MPRGFRFRLATLERVRRQQRDQQQRKLAELAGNAKFAAEKVERLRKQVAAADQEIASNQSAGAVDIDTMKRHVMHQSALKTQIEAGNRVVVECNKEVEKQRALLVEAARRLKVIEKLRERRWEEYQKELQKSEASELDEAAIMAFASGDQVSKEE